MNQTIRAIPEQAQSTLLVKILSEKENEIVESWFEEQKKAGVHRENLTSTEATLEQCHRVVRVFNDTIASVGLSNIESSPAWESARQLLGQIVAERANKGYTPNQVVNFLFLLKKPLFWEVRKRLEHNADRIIEENWNVSLLINAMAISAMGVFLSAREKIITKQQETLLEILTPVIKIWDGVLALPLIGTIDSRRAQVAMETLLGEIVRTSAGIAIIDVTGVPVVDTAVAQHLLKTVSAIRLIGARCIVTGIRPQIAQTMVHLGIDMSGVTTCATLADGFRRAIEWGLVGLTETISNKGMSA